MTQIPNSHFNREELISARGKLVLQIENLESSTRPKHRHADNLVRLRAALAEIESDLAP